MTRVVFAGTPHFAVPTLLYLLKAYDVVAVVTSPDKPAGRGRVVTPSPVKEAAREHGLEVLEPVSLKDESIVARLSRLRPTAIVVAAYGRILPARILNIPPKGCINVHASLLPKYRGAAPIVGAILGGERETGITIMLMDEGMDTGPILSQARLPIEDEDTAGSLGQKLAGLGAELLIDTLSPWLAGEIEPAPQDHALATYTKVVKKEDGLIDWSLSAAEIGRRVRAYNPWPSAYTHWRGQILKILRAHAGANGRREEPGRVVALGEGLAVSSGDGLLVLEEVQLASKKAVAAHQFVLGHRDIIGNRVGE